MVKKAITFEEMEDILSSTKCEDDLLDAVTILFEQIKTRAIGDCYLNTENYEHRMDDIIYICDLFLEKENKE